MRLDLPLERARRKMEKENPDSIMKLLLSLLANNPTPDSVLKEAKEKIEKIVKHYRRNP